MPFLRSPRRSGSVHTPLRWGTCTPPPPSLVMLIIDGSLEGTSLFRDDLDELVVLRPVAVQVVFGHRLPDHHGGFVLARHLENEERGAGIYTQGAGLRQAAALR